MSYRKWILLAILLFGTGLIFGSVTPAGVASLMSEDIAALKELARILAPFEVLTMIFIFIKNVSALLISFILSPFFCLAPIVSLFVNGWLLAFLSAIVIEEKSLGYVLMALVPHGIFELPALIIGEAAALSFGTVAMLSLFKKERGSLLLSSLKRNLRYLMVAFALLVPAAIIETYITPLLIT